MQTASTRILLAALWPLAIWPSLGRFNDHPADDYVEMTSPIVGVAVGFWIAAAVIAGLWFANGPAQWFYVLLMFLPVIYCIGFALYVARDQKFPR